MHKRLPCCTGVLPGRPKVMGSPKQPAKLAMLLMLPLLLLRSIVLDVHGKTIHENNVDLHALIDFKLGITTDDPPGLRNWNTTTHFCRWHGVICTTTRPFRVSWLNLTAQNLQGQITPSLGNLTFLTTLDLSVNSFVGSLPILGHLQKLHTLFLNNNNLNGIIPDSLTNCSNLANLDLSLNQLTGVIPPRIGNLTKLIGLSLNRNNFTGIIPPALGTIATLMGVYLEENQLSGQIPHELWQMPNIVELTLSQNSLSGGIPQILPNMSSLVKLSLSVNMLGGSLPPNIGNALPSLQLLFLGRNMFEGHIPASLGNASGFEKLSLAKNNFSGQIPRSFGMLSKMTNLDLEGNKLEAKESESWEFLDALANCSLLTNFLLSDNQLEGVIPNSIGNLSIHLQYLAMGGNKLSGVAPPSIGNFRGLVQLSLDDNNLTGTIDDWIGKLLMLQHLNLEMNKFIGTIPPSISNLSQLTFLSLAENQFTGSIPPSLGNLQNTLTLNLSYNNLSGIIPVEFGNLTQLTNLDLSSNKFSGEIPISLGQCRQLVTFQMDQNVVKGNVPTTFSNLYSLTLLNLSHNNLSGPLPASLNDLKLLSKLDLSYNTFQGEIPISGVFQNATVVLLDGNPGLCGGTMELHMPPCPVSQRARSLNYWIKILIPVFGFLSLILLVYVLVLVKKTSRRQNLDLQPSSGEYFLKVTYKDLAQATRDFSELNLIGRGSYGMVYRGKLKETIMEVAVKVFNLEMRGAERSFMAECEALRSIQHRNLLPIITACSTVDNAGNIFKALVYEFMPNGNLDMWLHQKGEKEAQKPLGFTQRLNIAVNIADALDYLHHDCGRPTVHCDLKPSNILLDEDLNALLADFGIARFYAHPHSPWAGSTSSIGLKGTIGYIPPEYCGGGHTSMSGDVYSFGIVLLEIFTGKRPTDPIFMEGVDIVNYVDSCLPDQTFLAIDDHLVEESKKLAQEMMVPENVTGQCLLSLLQVALSCTHPSPSERLNMKKTASKMHAIRTAYVGKER
ncbi:unnamed protein product [Alopecurus aequalis]